MQFGGFVPYDPEAARIYEKRRWWLGLTLGDMLDKVSDLYPAKEALVGEGRRYTYSALRRLVDNMAYRLIGEGFKSGDTVLLQLPNCPEFVIAYFALQKAGGVVVLLTVNHTAREISHLVNLTKPKGWILPGRYRKTDFMPVIRKVRKDHPALDRVILVGDETPEGCTSFDGLLRDVADRPEVNRVLDRAHPQPTDVCQILPSGGTTGLPKGAPRTHNDYLCNVEYKSMAWYINVTDTCLVASTVGHNLALLVCVTGPIFHGAKVVLLDSTYPQDSAEWCRMKRSHAPALSPH